MATISSTIDDTLRHDTSHTPSSSEISLLESSEFAPAVDLDLASSLTLPEDTPRLLSPLQIKSAAYNPKQHLSGFLNGAKGALESLGPENANAEINIAGRNLTLNFGCQSNEGTADGSFIESSSGSAIRELKRYYDQLAGVGPALRSPYAITGFVNQHGKSMYRLAYVIFLY